MTKAIGYVRRSTDRQEESLDQQRTRLAEFAKVKGWQLVEVFADDAISGSEMKRPGLDKLLQAIADAEVEVVLAWDRNRLARPKDAVDGLMLERQIQRAGKRVIYAATGQEADRSFTSGLISFVEHHQNGDYLRKAEPRHDARHGRSGEAWALAGRSNPVRVRSRAARWRDGEADRAAPR
jgi:DNA invertase Pin-like site-specific DNA recombinase